MRAQSKEYFWTHLGPVLWCLRFHRCHFTGVRDLPFYLLWSIRQHLVSWWLQCFWDRRIYPIDQSGYHPLGSRMGYWVRRNIPFLFRQGKLQGGSVFSPFQWTIHPHRDRRGQRIDRRSIGPCTFPCVLACRIWSSCFHCQALPERIPCGTQFYQRLSILGVWVDLSSI